PVISTPVKDVVTQSSATVEIVKTTEEFVFRAADCMLRPDKEKIARGIAKAQASSWETTVATMEKIIKDAIKEPNRPSTKKVEQLPEFDDKAYEYLATQGS